MATIVTTAAETAVLLSLMRWAKTGTPHNPLVQGADYGTLATKLETARVADAIALAVSETGASLGL